MTCRHVARGLALTVCASPGVAFAQQLGTGGGDGVSWWRVIGALLLCLVLAVAAAVALKARNGGLRLSLTPFAGGEPRKLAVIDRIRLNPQVEVCLLECEKKRYLVATTASGCSMLAVHETSAAAEAGDHA